MGQAMLKKGRPFPQHNSCKRRIAVHAVAKWGSGATKDLKRLRDCAESQPVVLQFCHAPGALPTSLVPVLGLANSPLHHAAYSVQ